MLPVFTIGHLTRTVEEFAALLKAGNVRMMVDVRKMPRSRTNPQFNQDMLADALAPWQVGYMGIAELGGLRKKSAVADDVNAYGQNRSFHNYADCALGMEFQTGLDLLLAPSAEAGTAIMCAEAFWWRCHRRIIADYLIHAGREVFYLMGDDEVHRAKLTDGAIPSGPGLIYPPPNSG